MVTKEDWQGFLKTFIALQIKVEANLQKSQEDFKKLKAIDRDGFRIMRNTLNKLLDEEQK